MKLNNLLARLRSTDPETADAIASEVHALASQRRFGLVFEQHQPETVELPGRPARVGDKVRILAPRRTAGSGSSALWRVRRIDRASGQADLVAASTGASAECTEAVDDLVVVAEFDDPIYPGLREVGRIDRDPSRAHHALIKAENYHALQTLTFTHAGQVDCIYIDPPYNTGATDWKYNNNYVDENDHYRHSKWLSMMERRLTLAKALLKDDGVLIVTIDEHEVHHLGVLLEQLFPAHRRPMVTIVMNSAGNTQNGFYRVDEYALFCFPEGTGPTMTNDDFLKEEGKKPRSLWGTHIRSGGVNDTPAKRPNLVYPIAIDEETGRFVGCGRSLQERHESGELGEIEREDLVDWRPDPDETLEGHHVLWPFSKDNTLGTWRNDAETFARLVSHGFVRVRRSERATGTNRWSLSYVTEGNRKKVADGIIPVLGVDPRDGSKLLGSEERPVIAKTVWKRRLHDATNWGSPVLSAFVGSTSFKYPKSPYAVRDTLATVVGDRPNALVLDFFAGSGTTLQAVCMLNARDGGSRRALLVTNNEVGDTDARRLAGQGFRAGDAEWEALGIFDSVTRPRCEAVITGVRPDGELVEGDYDDGAPYSDGFPENISFLEMTYQTARRVAHHRAFDAVAPLLWLRAGSRGRIIRRLPEPGWDVTEQYGVLQDLDQSANFVEATKAASATLNAAFIVTDSDSAFQRVSAQLPSGVEAIRLYESYLANFAIAARG